MYSIMYTVAQYNIYCICQYLILCVKQVYMYYKL